MVLVWVAGLGPSRPRGGALIRAVTFDALTSVAAGDEVFGLVPTMPPAIHDGAWAELPAVSEAVLAKRPVAVELAVAGAAPLAAVTAVMAVDGHRPVDFIGPN